MSRLWKAIVVTLVLGLSLGALGGVAQAEDPVSMSVPVPRPGDTAFYHIKDVIDDPDAVLGPMHYDWSSITWGTPTTMPTPSGAAQPVVPVRYHTMYAQGQPYEVEKIREIFMTSDGPLAERWPYRADFDMDPGDRQVPATGTPVDDVHVGEVPAFSADYSYTRYHGPKGLCGLLAPIHGADEPPARMEVPGYCRHNRLMGDETHTTYQHVATTEWNDRTAYVYRPVGGPAYNLTYADGVPFPVEIEVTLSETVYDPWEVGRHFRFELQGYTRDGAPAALPAPVGSSDPLPTTPRMPDVHIDEAGIEADGLMLREAFDAAMADGKSPRLSDFMAREGAYLGAAFRTHTVDSDGRIETSWSLFATTGDEILGKHVAERPRAALLDLEETKEIVVEDYPYSIPEVRFPPSVTLPDRIVSVAAALDRQPMFHPRNTQPDTWGFYHECVNEACTETRFEVRAGQALFPEAGGFETQGRPAAYQRNVFFGEDGLAAHSFRWEADGGSDGLIAPQPQDSIPASETEASASAWAPPTGKAAASVGFLALLGGAVYYFWPALKGGLVGLFSRIRKDEALDNPRRQQIMDLIEAEPGIHFQELVRRMGVGRGTLEHHVQVLVNNGYIVEARGSGYNCYYAKGAADHRVMQAIPAMKSEAGRKLLAAVIDNPGVSGRRLATELGLASSTVSYHTKRLLAAGLVTNGDGLRPTELAAPALAMTA